MTTAARNAAILGGFLGDALALGLHWNYEAIEVARQAASHLVDGRLATLLPPVPGSYHAGKHAGDMTHYGDQALVLLESLDPGQGFSLYHFHQAWQQLFQGNTGYVDAATRGTLDRLAAGGGVEDGGGPSKDLSGAARLFPLLAAHGDDLPALRAAARAQARMTHNHPQVLDAASFLATAVFHLLRGAPMLLALQTAAEAGDYATGHVQDWLRAGLASAGDDTVEVIGEFGQSCTAAEAFPAVIHLAATYADDFALGLTRNVLAGGDSAARGMAVGMLLGAAGGMASLPGAWLEALQARPRILACLELWPS